MKISIGRGGHLVTEPVEYYFFICFIVSTCISGTKGMASEV